MSLLRKTTTSPALSATPRLLPSAKPWLRSWCSTRTRSNRAARASSASPIRSADPLSTITTSRSSRTGSPVISDSTHAVVSSASSYVGITTEVSPGVGTRASSADQSTRWRLSTASRWLPGRGRSALRRSGKRRRTPTSSTLSTARSLRSTKSSSPPSPAPGSIPPPSTSSWRRTSTRDASTSHAPPGRTTRSPLPRVPSTRSATTSAPVATSLASRSGTHSSAASRKATYSPAAPSRSATSSQEVWVCASRLATLAARSAASWPGSSTTETSGCSAVVRRRNPAIEGLSPASRRRTRPGRTAPGRRRPRRGRRA